MRLSIVRQMRSPTGVVARGSAKGYDVSTEIGVTEWRGAIVVILSDGWDRGDSEALGEQMQDRAAHPLFGVGKPAQSDTWLCPACEGHGGGSPVC